MSDLIAPAPNVPGPCLTLVRVDDRYVDYYEVVRPWLVIRRYAIVGLGVLVALFGGLIAWSVLALNRKQWVSAGWVDR